MVYADAFLDAAATHVTEQDEIDISLDQVYLDNMKAVARERVTEAGYRLAAWLSFFAEQQ